MGATQWRKIARAASVDRERALKVPMRRSSWCRGVVGRCGVGSVRGCMSLGGALEAPRLDRPSLCAWAAGVVAGQGQRAEDWGWGESVVVAYGGSLIHPLYPCQGVRGAQKSYNAGVRCVS